MEVWMPKGSIQETRMATRAVQLREQIRELEVVAAGFQGRSADNARGLLTLRDSVEKELSALEEQGMDLRPERTRVKTIDNILVRKAQGLERALGSTGGLAGARRDVQPSDDQWWWFLDEYIAEQRRKSAKKFITIFVVAAVLLIGGNWAMNRFFGMDPVEREARGYISSAEQALAMGNFEEAIAGYQQAIETQPEMSEAHIGLGVLYALQGRDEESQQALARAEELVGDRSMYLLALSRAYSSIGEMDQALEAAEEAVELSPRSAQAYLIRGGVYEAIGRRAEALTDYELSGELAREQGEDALYVLARMRMGMLLQSGAGSGMPGGGGTGF
jgi:tetratricopeptide (TPR) repeat protein